MNRLTQRCKQLLAYLLVAMTLGTYVQPAAASFVSTTDLLASERQQQARQQVAATLQREEVRALLATYGVSPEAAAERAAQLSDAEIALIDEQISALPAGSSDIIGLLLVLFIVFVITDALGATDVFPFVHPVSKK